jgi:sulfate adenylyltransferase
MKNLLRLNKNQEIDLFNIITHTYHPITWFAREQDFNWILDNMRLKNWVLWPIPIILDINKEFHIWEKPIDELFLEWVNWKIIAKIKNPDIFPFNKEEYCLKIFWVNDIHHPWVKMVNEMWNYLVWWEVIFCFKFDEIKDFLSIYVDKYLSPTEIKKEFKRRWWKTIVAFQTRNPPHRSHEYIQKCALEQLDGLLIHPVTWEKKKWDFLDDVIIQSYDILISKYYNKEKTILSTLPMYMKYAWPREAIFHAIIRQNFWCTHIIIWRDHAGVSDYYWPYDSQDIFNTLNKNDLKIKILKYEDVSYCTLCKNISSFKTCPHTNYYKTSISWTTLRWKFIKWEDISEEFMRPEVSEFIKSYPNPFV